jgi:hypothetical protein
MCYPEDYWFTAQEMEYLGKLDWAWYQLLPQQRSNIVNSVIDGTLRQGSNKHCFIAEAMSTNRKISVYNDSLLDKISRIVKAVFYQGPSFDLLFHRDFSAEDRKKLNDVYYARIGDREHQYQKATELVRVYVTRLLIKTQQ